MIFISKNEKGEVAWQLIQQRRKTVTRRYNYVEPKKIRAVQPGRTKKAVCYIKIKSCMTHLKWAEEQLRIHPVFCIDEKIGDERIRNILDIEGKREGFETWDGLVNWFGSRNLDINKTYRLEFELYEKKDEIVC